MRASRRAGSPLWVHALLSWAVVRTAAYVAGVRFHDQPASWFWQYADLTLLRDRPWESLFYLHAQPPGFNAFLALGQQTSDPGRFYEITFRVVGAVCALGVARAFELLGVSRRGAIVGLWTFAALPSSILYESWLFYSLPVATCVLWASILFARASVDATARAALRWGFVVVALVLLRSVFHWTWLMGALALFVVEAGWLPSGRKLAVVLAVVVLGGAVFVKNALVFGTSGSSTWLGMSLAKHALEPLSREELDSLVEGEPPEIARLARTLPFSPVSSYRAFELPARFADVPVLSTTLKANGNVNLNHASYLEISAEYLRLSKRAIARHPSRYLGSVGTALVTLGTPSVEYWELLANLERIRPLHSAVLAIGALPPFDPSAYRAFSLPYLVTRVSVVYTLFALLVLAWTCAKALPIRRSGDPRRRVTRRPVRAFARFALYVIGFSTVVQVLLEVGENHRIAYELVPLGWVVLVAALDAGARRVRALARV
jgi:hypothetical protein